MPWANGRGRTIEMIRVNAADGGLLWRLSMASVMEDGPFSIFPGIERNLTVISGPGFDLIGDGRLHAAPLVPVAFAGDVPIAAAGVTDPSDDFNVMTARALPRPFVQVLTAGEAVPPRGGFLCLFALAPAVVCGKALGLHDLLITDANASISAGQVITVGLLV